MLAGMAVFPVWWELRHGRRAHDIGLQFPRRWVLFLLLSVSAAVVFTLLPSPSAALATQGFSLPAGLFFGAYFLCVAAAEETMFRGVLQRRIREESNSLVAIGISSGVFLFWHGLPGSCMECCLRIAGAVMLGVLFDRSGSLLPPAMFHWLANMAQVAKVGTSPL
jgi:membrane protease YdiL (CAAX protease family)